MMGDDDMLSSFITTQKKKQKKSVKTSKQRQMEIELGLADEIDDLLDEMIESEGSEDEANRAKAATKKATSKSRDEVAGAMAAQMNATAKGSRKEAANSDVKDDSEENVTEDITVEEIILDDADYVEHVEPLPHDDEIEAAKQTNDMGKETRSDNKENSDNDSPAPGIERRQSDLLMSPKFPLPRGGGLPPIAGRAGALPPLTGQAKIPSLGAQAGTLRPRRKKNKNKIL